MRWLACVLGALAFAPMPAVAQTGGGHVSQSSPLAVAETFTIESRTLGEVRRINVYVPPAYAQPPDTRVPVLYMPDGGLAEDFLHIAGLVQVLVGNGSMRPFLLVGIENTQRRRDLTGPTQSDEDKKIAPQVGGSAAFRKFIRAELMPVINARYRTTTETVVMGESLAGPFVVETLFVEPDLFDTYIAFDPSLWWNNNEFVKGREFPVFERKKTFYPMTARGWRCGELETCYRVFGTCACQAKSGCSGRERFLSFPLSLLLSLDA